jgi:hypothetical protein
MIFINVTKKLLIKYNRYTKNQFEGCQIYHYIQWIIKSSSEFEEKRKWNVPIWVRTAKLL